MKEQGTLDLADVQSILLSARIDAACDNWHLDERALPSLEALAKETGEAHLHKAIEHLVKAGELFEAARVALLTAERLMDSSPQRTER